jgi:erythromycin esterase
MKKTLLSFALIALFTSALVIEDNKVKWLKKNAIPISIDPTNEDFSDLKKLKTVIGDADVVLLGEQTHGDGTTFEAKCRLVKFLHQEMNFDILAFESCFYSCDKVNKQIYSEGMDAKTALRLGTFPQWTYAKEFSSLPKYIDKVSNTNRPLEICGFDCQMSMKNANSIKADLLSFIAKKQLAIDSNDANLVSEILDSQIIDLDRNSKKLSTDSIIKFKEANDRILKLLKSKDDENKFWQQCLNTHCNFIIDGSGIIKDKPISKARGLRDSLMAENFIWIKNNKYPNKKIIVWAASFHNMRRQYEVVEVMTGEKPLYTNITFGDILNRRLNPNKIYNLGFSAAQGHWAICFSKDSSRLSRVLENSFEDLAIKAGLDNAIVNFRQNGKNPASQWLNDPLKMRILGPSYYRSVWGRHLDGVCFTKNMKRAHDDSK